MAQDLSWNLRRIVSFLGLATIVTAAAGASSVRIYSSTQTFGPYTVAAGQLQQLPAGVIPIGFEETVWVLGYTAQIVDELGTPLAEELQCHTMMMSPVVERWQGSPQTGQPFKGFFSDGFTPQLLMPEGFGILLEAGEELELAPMFNNRGDEAISAAMSVKVDFVRAADLPEPLTPLYSTVAIVTHPHLYMVPPGGNVRERELSFPYSGVIHAMGVHIHPYGRSLELVNTSRGETVWTAEGTVGEDGQLTDIPFYSSQEGYAFTPEDRFLLRATYANPTDEEQDAMAGLFIFFATEDGQLP